MPLETGQLSILAQRRGGEIEQPRADDAATPPDLGDLGDVKVEFGKARDFATAWFPHRPCLSSDRCWRS